MARVNLLSRARQYAETGVAMARKLTDSRRHKERYMLQDLSAY